MDHLCKTIGRETDQEIARQIFEGSTRFINTSIELVPAPYTGNSSIASFSCRVGPVIKMAAPNGSYEL